MASTRRSNACATLTNKVAFKFHDLEITREAVVLHFFDERTVISLKDITSYELKWHLHDPIFANKYWFLELTFSLKNGEEQSWPITMVKFDYLNDQRERRQHIEKKIADALSLALSVSDAKRMRKK
ncbi:MAG: hypothetical protein ACM3NN_00280 [Nitrospirota bacterium]